MSSAIKRAVIAVSSANPEFWPLGLKTGYFFTEVLHPYLTFKNHGFDVDMVSETGTAHIDQSSIAYAQTDGESRRAYNDPNHEIHKKLGDQLRAASAVNSKDYSIIFFAGGHGAAFDFPKATSLQKLAAEIYSNGGVIATVCHGPAIFVDLHENNDKNAPLLIKGKKVTAFSTTGEKVMLAMGKLQEYGVPTMEDMMKNAGALWQEPHDHITNPMGTSYVVRDGRIVSGVNPMSAADVAQQAVEVVMGGKLEVKTPPKQVM